MTPAPADAPVSRVHAWLAARGPWQRRGVAVLAGVVATLGHAPFQLSLLYVAAISVLVLLLDGASARRKRLWSAFGAGFFFGLGHFVSGLHWIASAFLVNPDVWGPIWGVPAAIALGAGMALFWGFGAALAILLWTNDLRRVPAFAVAMFIAEWIRGHVFGGLPWLLPGYVWTPGEPISQLASVIGVYGLTMLTLLLGAAPAAIADRHASSWRRFLPLLFSALLIGMAWGWGTQRLAAAPVDPPGAQPIVRVAESGLSQADKWRGRPDQEWRVLQHYLEASGRPEDSRSAIVIWPEGAIPVINFYMLENQDFLDAIGEGMGDRVLVVGTTRRERRGRELIHFNSAAVIDGVSGVPRLSQIYDKHRLVPFGEIMPLEDVVMSLGIPSLQQMGGFFTPGAPPTRLVVPGAPTAVVLICYEAIFPAYVPSGEERPGWLISVTNDSWFGNGVGPWQHFAMARYRSIEEGLPMARAASGGISAIVDSFGRSVRSTHDGAGFAEAQLPPALTETPFSQWGFVLVMTLAALLAALRFALPSAANKGSML